MEKALQMFATRFSPPRGWRGGAYCVSSLTGSAHAFAALSLAQPEPRIVVAVTPGLPDADRLSDDLRLLVNSAKPGSAAFTTRILEFPPLLDGDKSLLGTRLKTLAAIRAWDMSPYPCIVATSQFALAAPVPSRSVASIRLSPGGAKFPEICESLAKCGYNRVPIVEREGDYSVRGGIIDAWSPGEEFPVRAEFFGDDLESLRTFNAATQLSIERVASAELLPATEDVPGSVSIAEAMEMTERFSDPEDKSFVNGILGTILREHEAQA